MKKLFTIVAFALSALSMMAEEYTCPLLVDVEGTQTTATQTVTVTKQDNGKYTLSLKNFKMGVQPVGNIEVKDVDAIMCGTTECLSTQQTIQIAAGDDTSINWIGPGLGDVPIFLKGELVDQTFNAILSISMNDPEAPLNVRVELGDVKGIGQIPNSDFEEFHQEKFGTTKEDEANHWHSFLNCDGSWAFGAKTKHCWKSSDVRPGSKGSYSVEIKSRTAFGASANGTITTGRIQAGSTDPKSTDNCSYLDLSNTETDKNKDPYYTILNSKPDAISVWVKLKNGVRDNSNKDNVYATISAAITDGTRYQDPTDKTYTNVVATAKNDKIESKGEWENLTVPFNYTSNTVDPKAILVTISTCSEPGGGSLSDKDGEQDDMFIDDLSLVYNAELTSLKFKGEEITGEDGMYETEFAGEVNASDIEVTTNSKTAYVSKTILPADDAVLAIINVVSNDLKTNNRYVLNINGATTTGIKKPATVITPNGVQAIYNLAGQQVGSMTPGQVYIVKTTDGQTKKVIKK